MARAVVPAQGQGMTRLASNAARAGVRLRLSHERPCSLARPSRRAKVPPYRAAAKTGTRCHAVLRGAGAGSLCFVLRASGLAGFARALGGALAQELG